VNIVSGNNVTLKDVNGLTVGGAVSGNLVTTAGGGTVFNALTVVGTLSATANGAISQNGAIHATGTTTLAAGSGNNITLGNPGNNFSTVSVTSGNNVTLVDANEIDLGALTVAGDLSVTAGGDITDSGIITVADNATFAAPGGKSVLLGQLGNTFNGSVTFNSTGGGNLELVTVFDTTSFDIKPLTVNGILKVNSGGNITQSGDIGASVLQLTAVGSIKLGADLPPGHTLPNNWPFNNHVNVLEVSITGSGNAFTFKDAEALTITHIGLNNGDVTIAADSVEILDQINSGPDRTARVTLVPLTAGRQITLGSEVAGTLSLTEQELQSITAGTVQIGDINSGDMTITAGIALHTAPTLSIRSGGSITETAGGSIQVPFICIETDASAAGKTVSLLGANDFTQVAADGHPIHVNDTGDFNTDIGIDDCQSDPSQDRGHTSFVPIGSELIRFQGADKTIASAAALAGLSSVIVPVPKLNTSTFSGAAVSTEEASQILPAGSIGTLWLLLPFPPPEERNYKVEDQSKWTSGRIAAVGSTAGPQSAR
jgi:hypothetical protein